MLTVALVMSAGIVWADYVSGPNIAFSYLFLIPVALAARYNSGYWGISLAIILPLVRFCFYFIWNEHSSFQDAALNAGIRMMVLASAALLIDRVTRQADEIRVLRGVLPVCSFCRKIRDTNEQWRSLETYLAEHSEAKLSHTCCPECGRIHYPAFVGKEDSRSQPPDPAPNPK